MKKYYEDRPWGNFERFCYNEPTTVKLINVKPNSTLSLQYHKQREEFWRVVNGEGTIRIGEQNHQAKIGNEFFIAKETLHRISTAEQSIQVLEISFGQFNENDIIRVEDEYNRI